VISSDRNEVNKVFVVVKYTLVELLDYEHFEESIIRNWWPTRCNFWFTYLYL